MENKQPTNSTAESVDTNPAPRRTPIEFTAPDRPHHTRGRKWYMATGMVALLCLVYSVFAGAWSFSVVLLLAVGMYVWVHKENPMNHTIRFDEHGITYDDTFTTWGDCTGFWFQRFQSHTELRIEQSKGFKRIYVILINPEQTQDFRAYLSPLLLELSDRHERILDFIFRICKL